MSVKKVLARKQHNKDIFFTAESRGSSTVAAVTNQKDESENVL